MPDELKNIGEEYQRLSKEGFDAAKLSFFYPAHRAEDRQHGDRAGDAERAGDR